MPRVLNYHHLNGVMPPNSVYVGRSRRSCWGNPSTIEEQRAREQAIAEHREWLIELLKSTPGLQEQMEAELRGKDLICWCAPLPCHADFLLELANPERGDE